MSIGLIMAAVILMVAGFSMAIGYMWGVRDACESTVEDLWELVPAGSGKRIKVNGRTSK